MSYTDSQMILKLFIQMILIGINIYTFVQIFVLRYKSFWERILKYIELIWTYTYDWFMKELSDYRADAIGAALSLLSQMLSVIV